MTCLGKGNGPTIPRAGEIPRMGTEVFLPNSPNPVESAVSRQTMSRLGRESAGRPDFVMFDIRRIHRAFSLLLAASLLVGGAPLLPACAGAAESDGVCRCCSRGGEDSHSQPCCARPAETRRHCCSEPAQPSCCKRGACCQRRPGDASENETSETRPRQATCPCHYSQRPSQPAPSESERDNRGRSAQPRLMSSAWPVPAHTVAAGSSWPLQPEALSDAAIPLRILHCVWLT